LAKIAEKAVSFCKSSAKSQTLGRVLHPEQKAALSVAQKLESASADSAYAVR
jgi:hypothetical protein